MSMGITLKHRGECVSLLTLKSQLHVHLTITHTLKGGVLPDESVTGNLP